MIKAPTMTLWEHTKKERRREKPMIRTSLRNISKALVQHAEDCCA